MIEDSTNSHSSWALVDRWMTRCKKSHKLCNTSPDNTHPLPSRIIDVGLDENTRPRLLVSDGTASARYATMSHCWGSHMPFRLISNNISKLQEEIPIPELSKSFQDAFTITRRLGLRYLWVDSLCIIQDSETDWREQSARMSQIYSNSYCNIAAAHAADGTHGCFIARSPDLIKPFQIDLNWGPLPGPYYAIKWLYWREKVLEPPLNKRAWVCQERFLSPRNLYFGETELYWECCEVAASEHFPSGLPPSLVTSSPKGIIPHIDGARIRKGKRMMENSMLDAFTVWNRIVDEYTRGQLTYPTDKLVALSGMAKEMCKHTQSEYVAGMWRKHLAYQLLWEVTGIQWVIRRSRPVAYIAPSWSWASMNGHIEGACSVWFPDNREILIEISDARVELVSKENPFGQVKSGFLRIQGSLAQDGEKDSGKEQTFVRVGKFDLFFYSGEFKSACCKFSRKDEEPQSDKWGGKMEIIIL
ncbi:HET-domain-containing protein [Zopfia rhizophila CBS 207.26]|uniref:HET-domain-containing protein n=1 Tax=Zopfia rhizophila CBS 207.26 TaxID=1314779 RepID=A0A6A6EAH5_9PEZI|nr:HET-domain-containing protein [Zopfia rhizophila CBS 207.26]